jgi:hypothetical protein
MPPRGVRVGEPLALRAVLGEEPLPVRVGGHVGGVYRKVAAKLGLYFTEGREDAAEAGIKQRSVLAQLYREAVERPLRGGPAEHVREGGVLGNQRRYPRPRRDRVKALDEARADEGTSAVALPATPARRALEMTGSIRLSVTMVSLMPARIVRRRPSRWPSTTRLSCTARIRVETKPDLGYGRFHRQAGRAS